MPPPVGSGAELAREGLDAFSRRDFDASLAIMHPDIEWHLTFPLPDLPPGKTVFRGHDEVRSLWENFTSTWESMTIEIEGIEAEEPAERGEIVIVHVRFCGLGEGSGIEVDQSLYYVFEIEDDLLVRLRPTDSLDEARTMAGLDP